MGFAPLLDPGDIIGGAEVIAVLGFLQPAPLTGGFAGATADRSRTIKLAIGVVAVRLEEDLAAMALASIGFGTHRASIRKKIPALYQ